MKAAGSTAGVPLAAVLRIIGSAVWAEIDGETVVYDEGKRRLHILSPTATLIWLGIDGATSLDRLAHDLSRQLDADLGVVRRDVLRLAHDLIEEGLLVEVDR